VGSQLLFKSGRRLTFDFYLLPFAFTMSLSPLKSGSLKGISYV
jgi:hypothetical protein